MLSLGSTVKVSEPIEAITHQPWAHEPQRVVQERKTATWVKLVVCYWKCLWQCTSWGQLFAAERALCGIWDWASERALRIVRSKWGWRPRASPGWSERISPGQYRFKFGYEAGSVQERWCPPVGCTRGELNKETMAAFPPALTLMQHSSVFLCITLVLPESPCWIPGWVPASESVHGTFKRIFISSR